MKWLASSVLLVCLFAPGFALAETREAAASDLAADCDALLRHAIRGSFGWGWGAPEADQQPQANVSREARTIPIDATESAVLGTELFWAGKKLGRPEYIQAAFEVGRGVASVQARNGQIRAMGIMGTPAGPTDQPADVPERFTTRAALGLMLTLIDADPSAGSRLKAPATRAAFWLAGQQTNSGAWPTPWPPDAPLGRAYRIIRLNDSGFRDSFCALLLAGEVLDDANLRRYADRAIDQILALRVTDFRSGARGLWISAYDLDGDPCRKFPDLNRGYDLLAARNAMQSLLISYLFSLQQRDNDGLLEAARLVNGLPHEAAGWHQHYDRRSHLPLDSDDPATQPADAPVDRVPGISAILDAVTQIDAVGGKKYAEFLAERRSLKQRVAEQLCGVAEDSFSERSEEHASRVAAAGSWPISSRPGRLWLLLRSVPRP